MLATFGVVVLRGIYEEQVEGTSTPSTSPDPALATFRYSRCLSCQSPVCHPIPTLFFATRLPPLLLWLDAMQCRTDIHALPRPGSWRIITSPPLTYPEKGMTRKEQRQKRRQLVRPTTFLRVVCEETFSPSCRLAEGQPRQWGHQDHHRQRGWGEIPGQGGHMCDALYGHAPGRFHL
jgi:hypothetical protein